MFRRFLPGLLTVLFLVQFSGCSDEAFETSDLLGPAGEPSMVDLGLRLVPEGVDLGLDELSQVEIDQIALGSYIVNGSAGCVGCHSSTEGYLGGGEEFQLGFLPPDVEGRTSIFGRNLTSDPETGMKLTEAQFIESMQTGRRVSSWQI